MSESIDRINEKLIEHYGVDIALNLPNFRVSWTTGQTEKRYEEFKVFTESGIFLRDEKGVFEVPKYPAWPDKWVLERLMSTDGNPYLSVVTKFSYEPIWIFGSGNSEKQPIWRAVQLLVRNSLYGDPNRVNRSPADLEREEEEQIRKEKRRMKEILSEDTEGLTYQLKHGGAVFIDSEKQKRG